MLWSNPNYIAIHNLHMVSGVDVHNSMRKKLPPIRLKKTDLPPHVQSFTKRLVPFVKFHSRVRPVAQFDYILPICLSRKIHVHFLQFSNIQ